MVRTRTTRATDHRRATARRCLLVATAMLLAPALAAAADSPGIEFKTDLLEALQQADQHTRVTVVYFTAKWCTWCRKMSVGTFADERVRAMANRFVWVKVDIEDQRELAAIFAVQGVPNTVLLNVKGEVLAVRPGYMTSEQLLTLLRANVDKAQEAGQVASVQQAVQRVAGAIGDGTKNGKPDQVRDAAGQAVHLLAMPERAGRKELLSALKSAGRAAWAHLLDHLASERLAVRAAAADALAACVGEAPPMDPFAKAKVRAKQTTECRNWFQKVVDGETGKPEIDKSDKKAPQKDKPEKADDGGKKDKDHEDNDKPGRTVPDIIEHSEGEPGAAA